MKIGYLLKKRDACYWIRVLTPSSHLQSIGYESREELVELAAFCRKCRKGATQEKYFFSDDENIWNCSHCGEPLHEDVNEWRDRVLDLIKWADVVVFQRVTSEDHLRMMKMVKEDFGKPVVFSADDNYIDVPEWNSGYKYYAPRRKIIEEILRESTAVTVTTDPLRDRYLDYNDNVAVIRNSLDIELIDLTPEVDRFGVYDKSGKAVDYNKFLEAREGNVFVGWGGSPTHEKDLELIIKGLKRLVKRHDNLIFGFVGYCHRAIMEIIPEDRLFLFGLVPVSQYFSLYKKIFRENVDVGLAPVIDVPFNWSKSALKVNEYMALRVMPVASDLVTYQDAINDGYLVPGDDDYRWMKSIEKAAFGDDRLDRVESNRNFLEEKYNIKSAVHEWDRFYRSLV